MKTSTTISMLSGANTDLVISFADGTRKTFPPGGIAITDGHLLVFSHPGVINTLQGPDAVFAPGAWAGVTRARQAGGAHE